MSVLQRIKGYFPHRHPIRLWYHYLKAFLAALCNGFPARKLTVIAVTGTDGKTTTVSMITHILLQAGRTVGAVSTAFFQIGEQREENATHQTSMSPFLMQKFLRKLVKAKCEFAVLEVSSHGLVQGRVNHIYPLVAAITNTSPEHLDYHGSMEQYRKDKGRLFQMLKGKGTKVLSSVDESFKLYREIPSRETVSYGREESDLWISDIEVGKESSRGVLHTSLGGETELVLPLLGIYNLENALCAIGCALSIGLPLEQCLRALVSFRAPPGRLECLDEGQDFAVFVDFAVTVVAYEKTLKTLRAMVREEGRVLALCGCCGNRMKEKRPAVGRIVSEYADVMVISHDETYGEDLQTILEEVWSGVQKEKTDAHKIFDRREGIEWLLKEARTGDAVVFCGMGPYTTMSMPGGVVPWDEREVVREILRDVVRERMGEGGKTGKIDTIVATGSSPSHMRVK